MENRLLIIAGASAAGKTAAASRILELDGRFSFIHSATTRAKRGDGNDGEYIYYTKEQFNTAVKDGEILEYMEYAGELYGTPREELMRIVGEGKIPLLVLDLNGVESLAKAKGFSPCSVYVRVPLNVAEERLYGRYLNNPTVEGLKAFMARKERNIKDYLSMTDYEKYFYAFVKNDGSIDDLANVILKVFSDFEAGVPRNENRAIAVARNLVIDAKDKVNP